MAALVPNTGIKKFVDVLVADNTAKYIGIGSGTGQTAAATDLATTLAETRATGTLSAQTTNTTDDTFQASGTVSITGNRAITECGVFDAAGTGATPSGGNLIIYADFSVINLVSGDSITLTVQAVGDQA